MELEEIERRIKVFENRQWERSKLRVHMKHKTDMEKPSKYFLSAERQQHNNNLIKELKNTEDVVVSELSQMLEVVTNYYEDLFSSVGTNNFHMQKILDTVSTYYFEDDVIQDMEKNINELELFQALNDMAKEKAPGLDGLTVEFYLTFWHVIKNDFVDLVNYCYKKGSLPNSMNKALIRLIFKNKGERCQLKNWRPISLLNVDYKIISKVLTKRLRKLMPNLINEDQTCGVNGRSIQDNLMVLRYVIDYATLYNKEAAIISIDQEKAFDRIEWCYLFSIMKKMGVPPGLIQWITILYNNPMFTVNVNNFFTKSSKATRGIRQGCPLSPLLYSMCVEGLWPSHNVGDLSGISFGRGSS